MKFIRSKSEYPTKKELRQHRCPECRSHNWKYHGKDKYGQRRRICECGRTFHE